jgi:hypothetical protein
VVAAVVPEVKRVLVVLVATLPVVRRALAVAQAQALLPVQ